MRYIRKRRRTSSHHIMLGFLLTTLLITIISLLGSCKSDSDLEGMGLWELDDTVRFFEEALGSEVLTLLLAYLDFGIDSLSGLDKYIE